MKHLKAKAIGAAAIGLLAYAAFFPYPSNPAREDITRIQGAKTIEVNERSLSWKGLFASKHYRIFADDRYVGDVTGKFITSFGDRFEFRTSDGTLLEYEKESKRVFRLSLNRHADCYDAQDSLVGSIGEEKIKDFLSVDYILHIYDAHDVPVGVSEKFTNSAIIGSHALFGNTGNKEYAINRNFVLTPGDTYDIAVVDPNSEIPRTRAVLLTCIEDAIGDAH